MAQQSDKRPLGRKAFFTGKLRDALASLSQLEGPLKAVKSQNILSLTKMSERTKPHRFCCTSVSGYLSNFTLEVALFY